VKVLLVGGAGLIGSGLEKELNEQGFKTLVLDNFTSNSLEHPDIHGEVVSGNACSFSTVNRVFAYFNPEVVFHFVDSLYDSEGMYDFQKESDTCVNVANNIIKCAGLHGIKHVFLGSSGEVYKGGSNKPLIERAKLGDISYTGTTKRYVENMLRLASKQYNFSLTSLRYFQVYGNRKFLNPKHDVVSFFIDSILKKEGVVIVGPKTKIDILNVTDAVSASYIVFKSVLEGNLIDNVNIGSGRGIGLYDLFNYLSTAMGEPNSIMYKVPSKRQTRSIVADNSLLRSLGWKCSTKFEDDLDSLVEFREKI
jgi:UDP-glucose 4-epimerase